MALLIIKGRIDKMNNNNENQSANNNLNNEYMKAIKFNTFKLYHNEKRPSYEWNKYYTDENGKKVKVDYFYHKGKWRMRSIEDLFNDTYMNYGLPCGKVNGLWGLDLDFYPKPVSKNNPTPYDPATCEFRKTFGDPEEYIKKNNLMAVKTASGGYHIYFKYDNRFKQTACSELHIDTRSDGGYLVAPWASITKNGETKRYEFFNGDLKPIPEELGEWVLKNVINRSKKTFKPVNPKIIIKNPITNEEEEHEEQDIDLSVFEFAFTPYLMENIIKQLPKEYFIEQDLWIIFTTAMKQVGMKELWDKYSKLHGGHTYNKEKNEVHYEYVRDKTYFAINHILLASKYKNARTALDYYKLKPTPKNHFIPNYIFNQEKLGYDADEGDIFFNKHNDRVVITQADTGTGKTTEAKKFFFNKPFISIVSRISLGEEQVRVFKEAGIEVDFHEKITDMNRREGRGWASREGENVVITIDSLLKLQNWDDFNGYTIFLDEYNSLIEYLITCPLLNKSRQLIYPLFDTMIRQADKVIATDADINEISLEYMKSITEFKYVKNEYKHNNGIEAKELYSFESFIEELNKEDKWLIPCDSKTQSEIIGHINASSDYVLITSEGWYHSGLKRFLKGEEKSLDKYDRIIYSPAIVYGLDSVIERPVYCYFKEHTISPVAMIQQICRCRNIKYLRFLFTDKRCKKYLYHSPEHALSEIEEKEEYGVKMNYIIDEETGERHKIHKNQRYNELLAQYIYRSDCYNTNKFAHFIKIIRQRGFKVSLAFYQTKKMNKEIGEEVKEIKVDYFNECVDKYIEYYNQYKIDIHEPAIQKINEEMDEEIEDTKNHEIKYPDTDYQDNYEWIEEERASRIREVKRDEGAVEDFFAPAIIKVNEILKIPYTDIKDYIDYFLNPYELQRHFNISKYFNMNSEEIEEALMKKTDFNPNKPNTMEAKMLFLNKYRAILDMDIDIKNIEVKKALTDKQSETFMKEYKIVFERFRGKKIPDFKEIKTNQQYISKMYKYLFGDNIINTKKSTKNKKSITYYSFNQEELDKNQALLKYRAKPKTGGVGAEAGQAFAGCMIDDEE